MLVPAPYFSEYDHYAANVAAVLRPIPTTEDFELNVDELVGAVTERTRILLLNSPSSPTGAVYGEESLRALASVRLLGVTVCASSWNEIVHSYKPHTCGPLLALPRTW